MNSWAVRGWILFAALLAVLYAGWISLRHSQRSQVDCRDGFERQRIAMVRHFDRRALPTTRSTIFN